MSGQWLWARSEIRRGRWSLLMVALLLAIAGGVVTAGVAGARRAGAAVDRYIAESAPSSTVIFSRDPLDPELLSDLESDPRITAVYTSRIVAATPVGIPPGIGGVMIDVPDEFWGGAAQPRLAGGRYPTGDTEVAVSEAFAAQGFAVGDVVDMHLVNRQNALTCFGGGACVTEPAGTVTITGVIRLTSDLAPGAFSEEGTVIATREFVDARGGDDITFAYYLDVFTAPGVDVNELIVDYSDRIDEGDMLPVEEDFTGARRAGELQHDALLIAAAVVAAAGLLIAGQAFGRFLTRHGSDGPTLSSLGMTAGQRTFAAWLPGVGASVLGAFGVVPIAVALSPFLPRGVARRVDPDVGFHLDLAVVGTGVAVTLVVGATSAIIAAAVWARRSTASATATSISAVASAARHLQLPPSATMGSRFALEPGSGARRAPVIPMLMGASAAVAILASAIVLTSSLDNVLASPHLYGATWDLQVAGQDRTTEIGELIAADDRVDGVALAVSGELAASANGNDTGEASAVGMTSIKGTVDPVILDGRAPVGPNEVAVGSDTLAALGVSLGDQIEVSGSAGQQTMIVVGRTIVPVLGSQTTDTGLVVPLQTMIDLGGLEAVADVDVQPAALVTVSDPADLDAVRQMVEETGAALDGPFRQSSVSVLDELRVAPLYVAAFTAILGALAVFHALGVTARRRRVDLATMRALGSRPRQAASVIHWQGGVAASAALAIGLPIGIIGGRILWRAIATNNNVRVAIETPWIPLATVTVVALVGAAAVLAAPPAWSTRRRHPATDLRAE